MPLTAEQKNWLNKYVVNRARLEKMRQDDADQLAKVKPSSFAADADGTLMPEKDKTRKVTEGSDTVVAGLKKTGRIEDPADLVKTREQKREAHLQDILLRDEDGLNASLIAGKVEPVSRDERRDARKPIDAGTSAVDKATIEAARDKMVKARAADEYTQEQLLARKQAAILAGKDARTAKNIAIGDLGTAEGVHSLSHHASRHGPQTTMSEQVTRLATAFPPDKKDPTNPATTDYVTRTGETVSIPDSRAKGSEPGTATSWMGSGQAGLNMVEDALSKSNQSMAAGAVQPGQRLVIDTVAGARDPGFGHSVQIPKNAHDQPVDAMGAQLPSANQLDNAAKTPVQKQDVIRQRAEAVQVQKDVHGAKVITEAMPDGTFRTVTAYPDATVAAQAFGLGQGANTAPIPKNLAAETSAASLTQVTAAKADALTKRNALAPKTLDHNAKKAEAANLLTESSAAQNAVPAAKAELQALQHAARDLRTAELQRDRVTQAHTDAVAKQGALQLTVNNLTAGMAALQATHVLKKNEFEADKTNKAKVVAHRVARDKFEKATALLAQSQAVKAEVDKKVLELAAKLPALGPAVADAGQKLAAARASAEAKLPGDAPAKAAVAQRAIDAAKALAEGIDELRALETELTTMTRQAELAESLAGEMESLRNGAAVSDPPDPADVASDRKERGDALKAALAQSPAALVKAKAEWASEIDAVALMNDDARAHREKMQAELEKRRVAAVAAAAEVRAQVEAARKNVAKLVTAKAGAVELDKANQDLQALEAKLGKLAETSKRLKTDRDGGKRGDELRDRLDAANVALARARLAATAAQVEAEQAAVAAAADAPLKQLRAQVRAAEEKVADTQSTHHAVVAERREIDRKLRLARVQSARHTAALAARQKELQDAVDAAAQVGGPPLTPAMVKLRDDLIPNVWTVNKNKGEAKVAALEILAAQAEARFQAGDKDVADAQKALRPLAEQLAKLEPKPKKT